MLNQENLFVDIETIPDPDLPEELKPEPRYGNAKKPEVRAAMKAAFEKDGQVKTMSVNPWMCKIVSIQAWSTNAEGFLNCGECGKDAESLMLEHISHYISEHRLTVGHNITGFEIPVFQARSILLGKSLMFESPRRYQTQPFFDTCEVPANWNPKHWRSLDWYAARLGLQRKSADGSQVFKMWQDKNYAGIDEYCRNDVLINRDVYKALATQYV